MKDVASLVKIEQITSTLKTKKQIPLSATILAGILLALSPKEHVLAQEIEDQPAEIESKTLYETYHSLLNELHLEKTTDTEQDAHISDELSITEVQAIQKELVLFAENQGDLALAEKMQVDVATIGELEALVSEFLAPSATVEKLDQATALVQTEVSAAKELEEIEGLPNEAEPVKKEVVSESSMPPALQVETKSAEQSVSYTVCGGDTLNKIASVHNVTVQHLAQLNNIQNVNAIQVGQVLTIQGDHFEEALEDLADLGQTLTKDEFVDTLGEHAAVAAKEQNLYASVMIAQGALESGFGTSGLASTPNHNLYGMKGQYKGDSVVMRTREHSKEKGWYYVNAPFKKYPSYLESVLDHAAYIRRGTSWAPDLYKGVWRENTASYQDATAWLQGRYATDPAYASKLNRIIEMYDLTRFDGVTAEDVVVQPPAQPEQDVKPSTSDQQADKVTENTARTSYRVQRGDTLSQIALKYKMSVSELKALNNLKTDLIFVGQKLSVKKKQVTTKPTPVPTKPEKPHKTTQASYTVKRGDTLSRIAPIYQMSVLELKQLNNLKSDLIFVGQKLKVKKMIEAKPTPPKPTKPTIKHHTVKSGDTLSAIARRYQTTVKELKAINKLSSDLIYVNQQLLV